MCRASENPLERQPGQETGELSGQKRVAKRLSLQAVSMGDPGAQRYIGPFLGPFSWAVCTGGVVGRPGWPVQTWSKSGAVLHRQTRPQPLGPCWPSFSSTFSRASRGWLRCFLSGRPCLAVLGNTGPFRGAPRVGRAAGAPDKLLRGAGVSAQLCKCFWFSC